MDLQHLEKQPKLKEVNYTTQDGEEVSTSLLVLPAIMVSIPEQIRYNSNDTPWRLVSVKVKHPNNGIETKVAQLFESSYEMHSDSLANGMPIEVMIQREGEGAGLGKVQLPEIERFDIDAYAELTSEFEVEQQVVDEELVA